MTDDAKDRAERSLEEAIAAGTARDPRPLFRPLLRHLRQRDAAAFERAIRHFEEVLIPAIAGGADPLEEWSRYGRLLAGEVPGREVAVDADGRSLEGVGSVAESPTPGSAPLLLHLPDDAAAPALPLRLPARTTPAQDATLELLVLGRVTASAYD